MNKRFGNGNEIISEIDAGFLLTGKAGKSSLELIKFTLLFIITLVFCISCTIDPIVDSEVKDKAPVNIPVNVMAIPDAVPRYEKRTRAGNPVKYKVLGKQYKVLAASKGYQQRGVASWYGTKFHGKKTANGEVYNMYAMTAAHKTLPIPSYARVTNLKNHRSVVVRINDRGPFHQNRLIDLSYAAAVKLGIQKAGTGFVEVVTVEPGVTEKQTGVTENLQKETVDKSNKQASTSVYLQIGAFNSQENARELQKKLIIGQIKNSRIQRGYKQGNEMFKVQVGPINSVYQADEVNEKLAFLGMIDTQLIVEKNNAVFNFAP